MNLENNWVRRLAAVALLALGGGMALAEAATEEPKLGWTDSAEFGVVATDGNAESTSLGFKNTAVRTWKRATLTLKAAGVRVETEEGDPVAVLLPGEPPGGNFDVKEPDTEVTTETYEASGRYDRKITDRFFWFAGAGWDRNEPAGIADRWVAEGGVGNVWWETEDLKFKTNYGATFTKKDDVVEDPDADDTFTGARFAWEYSNKLTKTTTYTNELVLDDNVEETSEWRGKMVNGLAVAMSDRLALKVSLQWLYENEPAFEELKLLASDGVTDTGQTVLVELDELDTLLRVSLVVNFD